jgi:hypothetical protein
MCTPMLYQAFKVKLELAVKDKPLVASALKCREWAVDFRAFQVEYAQTVGHAHFATHLEALFDESRRLDETVDRIVARTVAGLAGLLPPVAAIGAEEYSSIWYSGPVGKAAVDIDQNVRKAGTQLDEDGCSTCKDTGEIDETLGGVPTADPHAPCPDCRYQVTPITNHVPRSAKAGSGNGWWTQGVQQETEHLLKLKWTEVTLYGAVKPDDLRGRWLDAAEKAGCGTPQSHKTYATREERDAAEKVGSGTPQPQDPEKVAAVERLRAQLKLLGD